jgi:AhpD family alkylhydroperoxidase
MNDSTKERIAIGASVTAHCQPCLRHHVAKARELGIADDDIRAAMAVGHQVEKGSMSAMRKISDSVLSADGPEPGTNHE